MKSNTYSKLKLGLTAILCAAALTSTSAQDALPGAKPSSQAPAAAAVPKPPEPTFDLKFKGGTPADLINAVREQARIHMNVIIPEDAAGTMLPALEVQNVTVRRLLLALTEGSQRNVPVKIGPTPQNPASSYRNQTLGCGFREGSSRQGDAGEPVWYFYVDKVHQNAEETPKNCRYYQLAQYLDTYSIEAISTAVHTGWKFLGNDPEGKLSFHQDTGLLVVFGTREQHDVIQQVLSELASGLQTARETAHKQAKTGTAPAVK